MNSRSIAFLVVVSLIPLCLYSEIKLPRLISNNMVLQRDTKLKIWGWASAGEKVSVSFNNNSASTVTASDGKWSVTFPQMKAGGPYAMKIQATNQIIISNILVGDVWVCSGQSNMELTMSRVREKYASVIANSANTNIRQFDVPLSYSFSARQDDVQSGAWIEASPQSVLDFSAVAYFFARELHNKYKIPIGLINSSVGGSPAEAWLSEEALKSYPQYLAVTNRFKNQSLVDSIKAADAQIVNTWNSRIDAEDEGLKASVKWFDPAYNTSDWKSTIIPGFWDDASLFGAKSPGQNTNGVVWFRKEIDVPASMLGQSAKLRLGAIVDRDIVYLNGTQTGSTGYQYPPRIYELKPGMLKEGKNVIAVRVINNSGRGGFVPDKKYSLEAGGESIDLKGEWQYRLGYASAPLPGGATTFHYQPAGLFNGMITPLLNYGIKGVIWYQGESNTGRPKEYEKLFTDVITDWRTNWNQGNFPFLYVQLANFMARKAEPSESNWAELREAQSKVLNVPNTGMAVAIDAGEWNDIHPLNKETIGLRLAKAAYHVAYNESKSVYSGPVYQSAKLDGNKVILSFSNIGSGLTSKGGKELKHFAIAGADNKFTWATAHIEGDKVIVWNDAVTKPIKLRYAWADNPEGANLYNKEGLPASPFRIEIK